ncbi:hypothetical protein [Roseateles flavus]|uniref:Lipocalin-like domain-containing protein n=1 Tax=Roseateles flavus TaxID=3149041 RepID=A0ABV0GHM9_9BURK
MTEATAPTAPPKGRRWATITAIRTRTMVVSVCALAATLWQGYAIQKHNRLMVQPILDTELNTELDGSWTLLVQNSGLGPARVTRADIQVDGKPQPSTAAAARALGLDPACMGSGSLVHFYRVNQRQMVLSSAGPGCTLKPDALETLLKRLSITLHYESLYGDAAVHQLLR